MYFKRPLFTARKLAGRVRTHINNIRANCISMYIIHRCILYIYIHVCIYTLECAINQQKNKTCHGHTSSWLAHLFEWKFIRINVVLLCTYYNTYTRTHTRIYPVILYAPSRRAASKVHCIFYTGTTGVRSK